MTGGVELRAGARTAYGRRCCPERSSAWRRRAAAMVGQPSGPRRGWMGGASELRHESGTASRAASTPPPLGSSGSRRRRFGGGSGGESGKLREALSGGGGGGLVGAWEGGLGRGEGAKAAGGSLDPAHGPACG